MIFGTSACLLPSILGNTVSLLQPLVKNCFLVCGSHDHFPFLSASVHHCPILPPLISTLLPPTPPPPSQSPLLLTRLSDPSQWEAVATVTEAIREAVFMLSHSRAGSPAVMSARTHTCTHRSTHAHTNERGRAKEWEREGRRERERGGGTAASGSSFTLSMASLKQDCGGTKRYQGWGIRMEG